MRLKIERRQMKSLKIYPSTWYQNISLNIFQLVFVYIKNWYDDDAIKNCMRISVDKNVNLRLYFVRISFVRNLKYFFFEGTMSRLNQLSGWTTRCQTVDIFYFSKIMTCLSHANFSSSCLVELDVFIQISSVAMKMNKKI